jgi:NAD(P)-dependent dehydrogenase (short-subunit alcohol dehydrogenase family)
MPKTIIILSVSSDIGNFLAKQYLERGWKVIGTYRQKKNLQGLEKQDCELFKLDITRKQDIKAFITQLKRRKIHWDRLICSVGSLLPAQDFFECDFNQWQESLFINAIGPLEMVHGLYPLANKKARIVFFAGGAANGAVVHLSAYAISKILLTKMTEFIDAEYPNLHVSIIGPGWTLTKIHEDILKGKTVTQAKLLQTKKDLKGKPSTSLKDIDACIEWVCSQPKSLTSGRNFSVVHDPWRVDKRQSLVAALKNDVNMYKLRRHGNGFSQQ